PTAPHTLSLHDALPILPAARRASAPKAARRLTPPSLRGTPRGHRRRSAAAPRGRPRPPALSPPRCPPSPRGPLRPAQKTASAPRSEEHTSELQSRSDLV